MKQKDLENVIKSFKKLSQKEFMRRLKESQAEMKRDRKTGRFNWGNAIQYAIDPEGYLKNKE